ncbi:MAG: SusD/RagB family nutrient-binding outer membrane lipoprotein [Tannerella sp.]|jgi:hypothetical protein|nr:SusD/RagB family nutrient-binding outer membrane lipoprotein [Tannerella sp.]
MKSNLFKNIVIVALILLTVLSCDTQSLRDLDNPKYMLTKDNADMSLMFTNIIINYGRRSIGGNPLSQQAVYIKYYSTYSNIAISGALNQFSQGINDNPWNQSYPNEVSMVTTLENFLVEQDNPNMVNNLAMTRILKAAIFMRLTDFYGDIPYTEAGKLAISSFELNKPVYDTQESIYKDLLSILETEAPKLTAGVATTWSNADLSYNGNMTQWKKFAYSLMLRGAMRISDADQATSRKYAELAIANGVILDNADNYLMRTGTSTNPDERNDYSRWFAGEGGGDPERYMKLGQYFVDWMKTMNDPRRKIIFGGRLNEDIGNTTASDMSNYWRVEADWNWNLDEARGVAHGINANPELTVPAYHHAYTSPNPFLYVNTRPIELVTASEMLLLISEAALKGWNTGSYTAESAYQAGVKANMSQLTGYSGMLEHQTISNEEMDIYLAAHTLGAGGAAKTRLAEEMWITMYLNPTEGWFNVVRMGLNLPPNSSSPGFTMPRRMAYPENERSNNLEQLNAAMSRHGWALDMIREQEVQQRNWWDVANKQVP